MLLRSIFLIENKENIHVQGTVFDDNVVLSS